MSPPTERTGPHHEAGPTITDRIVPLYPRAYRIRRWARRELDALLKIDAPTEQVSDVSIDYWRDCHANLGVRQRELVGGRCSHEP